MNIEAIKHAIVDQVEYEESHKDAGESYSHLVWEGDCIDMRARLVEFCEDHEVEATEEECDLILDHVRDYFLDDFTSTNCFSRSKKEEFILDSFPIGEIQIELSKEDLLDLAETEDWGKLKREVLDDLSFCAKDSGSRLLFYESSEVIWQSAISLETVIESLEEVRKDN